MFATTDKAEKVPEVARRLVRIMGQGQGRGPAAEQRQCRGHRPARIARQGQDAAAGDVARGIRDRRAGAVAARRFLPAGGSTRPAVGRGACKEPGSPDEPPIVILYGTRWCKACKAARRYLVSNLVPFTSKDIEKDSVRCPRASSRKPRASELRRIGCPSSTCAVACWSDTTRREWMVFWPTGSAPNKRCGPGAGEGARAALGLLG